MRAAVMEEVGRLAVLEVPAPRPCQGEAVLHTIAAGVCGSDIHGFAGETGRRAAGQIMGHEAVGSIAAVTPEDSARLLELGLAVGDTVVFNPLVGCGVCEECDDDKPQQCGAGHVIGSDEGHPGAFAEDVRVPLQQLVPLPVGVPAAHGALVEPLAVAVHAVRRSGVVPGSDVVVIGGGPIGQCMVLAALDAGAIRVRASEPNAARRKVLLSLGAEELGPDAPSPAADVAIDAVGLSATLSTACAATREGGTVCLAGMSAPSLTVQAYEISVAERTLVGSFCYSSNDFREAAALLGRHPQQAALLVSATIGLEELPLRMAELAKGETPPGKVLVTP